MGLKGDPEGAAGQLGAIEGVLSLDRPVSDQTRFAIESAPGVDLREAIYRQAVERDWVLLELHEEAASLEDIFVRLTTAELDSPLPGAATPVAEALGAKADEGEPS